MNRSICRALFVATVCSGILFFAASRHAIFAQTDDQSQQWLVAGHDLNNSRSQSAEKKIGIENVSQLAPQWTFTTSSDVSATPTVDGDNVYFPDWAGNLYAVNRKTGIMRWSHQISEYDAHQNALSRTSPAIHGDLLIFGDILSSTVPHEGADIIAVSRTNGELRWITKVDNHPAAVITGSPVIAGDIVYVGVSSSEEGLATNPDYPCCSFRGSIVALDVNSGRILWKRYTVPDNLGAADQYSGNAVWQPPAIDLTRGLLFIGTGNNYDVPAAVRDCVNQNPSQSSGCFAADDYFDSALALDLTTGQIKWSQRLRGFDIWTVACIRNTNPVACPVPSSPDYDLSGSGPNLFPNLVGFGQKSGMYWALNPDTGAIVWSSVVGPGATLGGIEWGTATDGTRIYVAITNSANKSYPLINGQTITWGAWSALDVSTGKILWQTADPDHSLAMGAVSTANGVVYAPSISGKVHALNAATGDILFSFQTGGSVIDGPSISNGTVFWGSGYRRTTGGIGNNKVFAFSLNGKSSD